MSSQLAFIKTQPDGLRYEPDFISHADELSLIEEIRRIELKPFEFGQLEGKRRVAWFGWRYDYTDRKLKHFGASNLGLAAGRQDREIRRW